MKNDLDNLLSYINDNIRFGSEIKQTVVDNWFKQYKLDIEEKFAVYDELNSLQIKIIYLSKTVIKSSLLKLYKCIEAEEEINGNILIKWFDKNNIDESIRENILNDLEKHGYKIVDNNDEVIKMDVNLTEDLLDDDLDLLLEDDDFIKEIDSLEDTIDKSRNIEYLVQIHSKDESKRNEFLYYLVQANRKLIWKIVKSYSKFSTVGFDVNDMFQVGLIGLLKAAEKFDVSLGHQFSTYATWWIRQEITRGIANHSTLIRIPVHYREKMYKFLRIENELWNKLARPATTLELSRKMGESIDVIEELRFYISQSNLDSLDRLVGEGEGTSLGELVIDENVNMPDKEYFKLELRNVINKILRTNLTKREKQVFLYRFGFINDEKMTISNR